MYLRTERDLARIADTARREGRLGLDVEFIRERTYFPQLALIQLSAGSELGLLDPTSDLSLAAIEDLIVDPSVCKVLHAAAQDLEIFAARTGTPPRNIFDTQIAAALVGMGHQLPYSGVVSRVLGIAIEKGESFTDWLRRPLSAEQERYALEDVRHLLPLHDRLAERLQALGRTAWIQEECRHYEELRFYQPDPRALHWKVRRTGALDPRRLAILEELAIWRDREARAVDRPRRNVLSDEILVELVRFAPEREEDLSRFRGIPGGLLRRSGAELVAAIRRGKSRPDKDCPRPEARQRLEPAEALAADFLDACMRAYCHSAQIAPAMIASRSDLEALVWEFRHGVLANAPTDSDGAAAALELAVLGGWRGDLIGKSLLAVLRGEVRVYLDPSGGLPRFEPRAGS